jgi:hypothetical protein
MKLLLDNCTTAEIAHLLREHYDSLLEFEISDEAGILELS